MTVCPICAADPCETPAFCLASIENDRQRSAVNEDAEIARLAKLAISEYERERATAARRLGWRIGALDRVVDAERRKLAPDSNGRQGRPVNIADAQPWPESVCGAELLSKISALIRRYVILPEHAADTTALWAVFTHTIDAFTIAPRLAIVAPEKDCGKSTLLDCVGHLVRRPVSSASATPAVLFRAIELLEPTLLFDEAEHFVTNENSELLSILNNGHRRGGSVLRLVGDDHELRQFATFAPCAFALIGRLPATQESRSIAIEMRRRTAEERIEIFRADRTEEFHLLARKAARWAADNVEKLRAADPDVGELFNRVADNWRPPFAIADAAGGEWPERARKAAAAITAGQSEGSIGIELLSDIRDIFVSRQLEREVPSADLVEALVAMDGRPWSEFGHLGKPITQNALARLLKKFRTGDGVPIAPISTRAGERVLKGYHPSQFEDAFRRYLPPTPSAQPLHRYNQHDTGTSATFASATPDTVVADAECEKAAWDGRCSGVAVGNGGAGGKVTPLCNYCGAPATPADPLHPSDLDGWPDGILLHRRCEKPWHDAKPP